LSISSEAAQQLLDAGFLGSEVQDIAEAKTSDGKDQPPIDINSPIWQSVMKSRRDWWQDKRDRGWSEEEIITELMNYYRRDKSRTPYDFIRAEYKPPKKVDYIEIVRSRNRAQIIGEIDGYKFKT